MPTYVGLAIFVMLVVPGRYAFGPQGVRLSTTSVFGLVALLLWLSSFLFRKRHQVQLNPAVLLLLLYGTGLIFSAGTAYGRTLSAVEASGVLRGSVLTAASLGLALLLADGTATASGLRRMSSLIVIGGYFSAAIGMLQKLVGFGYIDLWRNVPGFYTSTVDIESSVLLSGRAVGTAAHPIEFSVACACLVPLALVHANDTDDRRKLLGHRLGAALLVVGALLGVSRSGFIGVVIVLIFCGLRMPFRRRINLLASAVVVLAFVQVALRGTLSTLRYQLLNVGDDASSRGRTSDYGPVFELLQGRLVRGIGVGTFNPKQYLYLDNAWLGTLIGGGVIGVVILAVVLVGAMYVGGLAKSRSVPGSFVFELAHAACVMLLVLGVCAYFFDELSFTQTATLIFVAVGIIGACWKITAAAHDAPLALAAGQHRKTFHD